MPLDTTPFTGTAAHEFRAIGLLDPPRTCCHQRDGQILNTLFETAAIRAGVSILQTFTGTVDESAATSRLDLGDILRDRRRWCGVSTKETLSNAAFLPQKSRSHTQTLVGASAQSTLVFL